MPDLQVFDVGGEGPEDVLVDPADGTVLTGVADGRVLRVEPADGSVVQVADTHGRPLGLEWLPDGRLLVCDARRGLLAVDLDDGGVQTLATTAGGRPVTFCNNAAVAPDGSIWFSDSSARFGIDDWKADILEHGGTGRLLHRDADGIIDVVVDGLHFPNGVALAGSPARIHVAETGAYSVSTCDPDQYPADVLPLLTNLPAFPDNMATGTDGLAWVAMATPRNRVVDRLAPLPGALRRVVWALPASLQPKPASDVWVVALEPDSGRVVHDLQGAHSQFGMTTGVREHHGTVWLGSLTGTAIACFELPGR
jgi:sugar lactone lactonase YvrE